MNLSDFQTLVTTVGFPIVVCGYLLILVNTTLKNLEKAIQELNTTIQVLHGVEGVKSHEVK